MKRLSLIVISLILISITSCKKDSVNDAIQIAGLKSSIDALQKRCDSLSNAVSNSNKTILNLTSEILTLTTNQNNQKLSIDSIKTQLVGILDSLGTISSQILQQNTKISNLTIQITQANTSITDINNQISQINTQIQQLNTLYNSLLSQLTVVLDWYSAPQTTSKGLIAYYPFQSGSPNDTTGHGHNGFIGGSLYGLTSVVDRFGNEPARSTPYSAVSFSAGSFVEIQYSSDFDNTDYSFSFWIKDYSNLGSSGKTAVISRLPQTSTDDNWVIFEDNATGAINLQTAGGVKGSASGTSHTNIADNKWHHIAFTVSSGSAKTYVDGVLEDSNSVTIPIAYKILPIRLGASVSTTLGGTYWQSFTGNLDDVRFYNRGLTQGEVTYLAQH